eukprot:gene13096-15098_t
MRGSYQQSAVLYPKVGRHYCFAAALSALGRPHSHDFAAELYLQASSIRGTVDAMKAPVYYKSKEPSLPGKLALKERAAASWQLAAEMAAAQATGSNSVRDDPEIQNLLAAAKKEVSGEWKVSSMVDTLSKNRADTAATNNTLAKCRDAKMLPLWQELAAKQDEATDRAELIYQRFLDGELDVDEATKAISEALEIKGTCGYTLNETHLCHTKAAYYKERAAQALQGARQSSFESKCWTQAAAYMDDVARMLLAYIDAGMPRGRDDLQDSKAVKEVEEKMKRFAAAAEYLFMAFKHRKLPDAETRQNGTRVTVLYERAALAMGLSDHTANSQALANKIIDQHVALINLMNGAEEVPAKDIVVRELISDYGASAFSVSDPVKQELWAKANDPKSADSDEKRLCFESAARVCEECFCVGENPPKEAPSDDDSFAESSDEEEEEVEYPFKLSLYHSVLAETVLSLEGVTSGLPSELTTFFEQAQEQSAEEEGLRTTAAEHATYIVLKNRCVQQCAGLPESDVTFDAWKAVQREVDVLLVLLHKRTEDVYEYHYTHLISLKVSFQALVVKCQVALAEAPPISSSVVVWLETLQICQNAAPKGTSSAKVYEDAVATAEKAVNAAQAHVEGADGTSTMVG